MPLPLPQTYQDGSRVTPFQVGPVALSRPYANTLFQDVYSTERRVSYEIIPENFQANSRLTARTSYTNLLTYSEAFDNGAWTASNGTVTADQIANPADGLVTADKILETAINNNHYVTHSYTFSAGVYTFTAFVRGGLGRDWVALRLFDGTTVYFAYFNITTGAVGAVDVGATSSIGAVGNSFYRVSITATMLGAAGNGIVFIASANSTNSYPGDITKGIYLWGAQLEAASVAGPYISTTSTSRTISSPDWWDTTMAAITPSVTVSGVTYTDQPDPFAFLVAESDPTPQGPNSFYTFTRTYARIPQTQFVYSTIPLTEPNASSLGISYGTLQDATAGLSTLAPVGACFQYLGYLWSSTDPSGNPLTPGTIYTQKSGTVLTGTPVATSGLFQITYKTSTTGALNWNDSSGTISAAVNALTDVSGDGLTVSVTNRLADATYGGLQFAIVVGSTTSPFTASTVSLNPQACRTNFPIINSPTSQGIYCSCQATITAHGYATSGNLVASATPGNGNTILFAYTTGWKVVDSNTIAFNGTPFSCAASIYFGPLYRNYTPGASRLRSRLTTSFYFPGVTPGITSATDIPIPATALSDAKFLALAINYLSGFQNYDATALAQWLGAGYEQTITAIDCATI